jgi:hypothetical protein
LQKKADDTWILGKEKRVNGLRSNVLTRALWQEEKPVPGPSDNYKLGVAGVSAEIILWNGESFAASFYLRMTGASGTGRETLGERLNVPETKFIPCKVGDQIELVSLDSISYVRGPGSLPEIAQLEQLGAIRQPARLAMQCGYVLEGQFLYVLPHARARLSDMLNLSTDRFLLFLAPAAVLYVNRSAIVRVTP